MQAAVFVEDHRIEVQDLPKPAPAPDEVIVKVAACGVCGTDVHIYHGHLQNEVQPPVVPGHEIAGTIESVGSDVTYFRQSQNVCIDPVVACGCCRYCRMARPNLCPNLATIGYVRNGGFAQFTAAPAANIYPLTADTPATAGILVETLACVLNGYDKLSLRPGQTAMVLGAGTVGLLWTQLLRRSPVSLLIVSEPVAFRRDRAAQLGPDLVVDPANEDLPQKVLNVAPEGIDCIIDASGDPAAVEQGIGLVAKSGTFVIFGICPPDAAVAIDPHQLYQKEMRIVGSKMPPYSLQRASQMVQAGMIDHENIVTDLMPLSELPAALDLFESARDRHVKMAIDPWA